MASGTTRVDVSRRMNLEGRVNLIFEELTPSSTRVTVNVRYVVTRVIVSSVSYPPRPPQTFTNSIGFNSGGSDSFPRAAAGDAVRCVPTGKAESDILALVN